MDASGNKSAAAAWRSAGERISDVAALDCGVGCGSRLRAGCASLCALAAAAPVDRPGDATGHLLSLTYAPGMSAPAAKLQSEKAPPRKPVPHHKRACADAGAT